MPVTSNRSTTLLLVRHAESLANREEQPAPADAGLTEHGWRQTHLLAESLAAKHQIQGIVSDGLLRARQTAEILGHYLRLPVEIVDELAEITGAHLEELPSKPEDPLGGWSLAWQPSPDEAPVYYAYTQQIARGLRRILERFGGQTVVVVTHGTAIATLLRCLFGGHQMIVSTENAAVTQVMWRSGHWRLLSHNDVSHLSTLLKAPPDEHASSGTSGFGWARTRHLEAVIAHNNRLAAVAPARVGAPSDRDLDAVIRLASPAPGTHHLDAATGRGTLALAIAPLVASSIGVDVSPGMLQQAEESRIAQGIGHLQFRWGDVADLAAADGSFDLVTCRDLLPYVSDLSAAFTSFRRVLATGGRLVVDELVGSNDPVKRATQDTIEIRRDPTFVATRSEAELLRLITEARLKVETVERYEVSWSFDDWMNAAATDDTTRAAVESMMEAGIEGDAAGISLRRQRDGALSFVRKRIRILALATDEAS